MGVIKELQWQVVYYYTGAGDQGMSGQSKAGALKCDDVCHHCLEKAGGCQVGLFVARQARHLSTGSEHTLNLCCLGVAWSQTAINLLLSCPVLAQWQARFKVRLRVGRSGMGKGRTPHLHILDCCESLFHQRYLQNGQESRPSTSQVDSSGEGA